MTHVDDILGHSGVKGMKWGVTKSGSPSGSGTAKNSRFARKPTEVTVSQKPGQFVRTAGGRKQIASEDAIKTAANRQKAKKSTTDSLTTKDLQEAVNRMNLEQQYIRLLKQSDRRSRGQKFIQSILGDPKKRKDIQDMAEKVGNSMPKRPPRSAAKTAAKGVAGFTGKVITL